MLFERLRSLHRRASAPEADTSKPLPIEGAFVVCVPGVPPVLRSDPVKAVICLYNCGTQNCRLTAIDVPSRGIRVLTQTGMTLPAFTALSGALKFEIEFRPLDLAPNMSNAEIVLRWREIPSQKTGSAIMTLSWTREARSSVEIAFDTAEVNFDDCWVDDIWQFSRLLHGEKSVSLCIERGSAKGVYPMTLRGDRFVAGVQIPRNSEAPYRFEVDGVHLPDETVASVTYLEGVDSPCTPLPPAGDPRRNMPIRNIGASTVHFTATCSANWLECSPEEGVLQADALGDINLRLLPEMLVAGEHRAELTVTLKAGGNAQNVRKLPVRVLMRSAGPICHYPASYDLGLVYFGDKKPRQIPVANHGDSVLELAGASEDGMMAVSMQQFAPGEKAEIPLHFTFPETAPKNGDRETTLLLTSNSYVESQKKLAIKLKYRIEGLRLEPPSIDFGVMAGEEVKTFSVYAYLGNETRPVPNLLLEGAPPWVTWHNGPGTSLKVFSIDGNSIAASGAIGSVLSALVVRDPASGAVGMLPLSGTFAHPKLRRKTLNFGKVKGVKILPLPIENRGMGNLIIKKVVLDQIWLQVKQDTNVYSCLQVAVSSQPGVDGWQEGSVQVYSNDPRSPVSTVTIRARFGDD